MRRGYRKQTWPIKGEKSQGQNCLEMEEVSLGGDAFSCIQMNVVCLLSAGFTHKVPMGDV